jgi:hypothetical protein
MASVISAGTTTTTSLSFSGDTSGVLQLQTNGTTTAVTIDTSQNVGIGVTPSATTLYTHLSVANQGSGILSYSGNNDIKIASGVYYNSGYKYGVTGYAVSMFEQTNGVYRWQVAPSGTAGNTISFTQAMTLDNSGNLLVGATSATYNSQVQVGNQNPAFYINNTLTSSLGASNVLRLAFSGYDINNSSCSFIQAYGTTTLRFNVDSRGNVTNSNNSYGPISDVKLKENIVDATPKLADILKLQVRNYNLKSDPQLKQIGFIAQELETVFPALINEHPDIDEEGKDLGTTTKSIKASVLVPMLVKAIQELSAQVTTLQSQVAALTPKA